MVENWTGLYCWTVLLLYRCRRRVRPAPHCCFTHHGASTGPWCRTKDLPPISYPLPAHLFQFVDIWFKWCWAVVAEKDAATGKPTITQAFCTFDKGVPLSSSSLYRLFKVGGAVLALWLAGWLGGWLPLCAVRTCSAAGGALWAGHSHEPCVLAVVAQLEAQDVQAHLHSRQAHQ